MWGAGLEDRPSVDAAHLARIKDGMEIESQRIKEIEGFKPSGDNVDAKIGEYDDAIKTVRDVVFDAKLLSDYLTECGHDDLAGRIDELWSGMRKAAFARLLVPKVVLLCETNKSEEAMKCLETHDQCDSPDIAVRVGVALAKAGLHDAAYEWIDRAVDMEPDHPVAAYNMALLEDEAGEYYGASEKLDWILDARRGGEQMEGIPDLDTILLHRGQVHAHEGDHGSAIKCYDEALGIRPGDPCAAYHKAESLYRTGACADAIEWFGKASGHMDADARRDIVTKMQDEPEGRVMLPLFVIGASDGIIGMPHLQHAVFLAQEDMGMQAYDFAQHGFGPYSRDLAEDVSTNTGLFEVGGGWNRCRLKPRTYSITERGTDILEKSGLIGRTAACNKYTTGPDLVDAAYSKFSSRLGNDAEMDTRGIIDRIKRRDESIPHTHGWVETAADHVGHVLSDTDSYTSLSRSAILNIARIIADNCSKVQDLSMPPVDHYALEDALSTLYEYGNVLVKYCEMRRITTYPNISSGSELLVTHPSDSKLLAGFPSGQGSHPR